MDTEVEENLKRGEVIKLEQINNATSRVGSQLEILNTKLDQLTYKMDESSSSSRKLAQALNVLTAALVLVGIAQVVAQFVK